MPGKWMTVSDWSNTDHATYAIHAWNRLHAFLKLVQTSFIMPRLRSTDCYVFLTVLTAS